MMEKEILARRQRMQELNCQAQDLVDAGHFDPNAVEETRIVMEERFVGSFFKKKWSNSNMSDQYQYLGNCPLTPPLTQH